MCVYMYICVVVYLSLYIYIYIYIYIYPAGLAIDMIVACASLSFTVLHAVGRTKQLKDIDEIGRKVTAPGFDSHSAVSLVGWPADNTRTQVLKLLHQYAPALCAWCMWACACASYLFVLHEQAARWATGHLDLDGWIGF